MAPEHLVEGRKAALQLLYQLDTWGAPLVLPDEEPLREFFVFMVPDLPSRSREFARELVIGVVLHQEDIDERLAKASRNWRLSRMDRVDRNVLRLAAFELLHHPETPVAIVINEAVELAKEFGHTTSGAFVHGLLSNLKRTLDKEPKAD